MTAKKLLWSETIKQPNELNHLLNQAANGPTIFDDIQAVPMLARVANKVGLEASPQNFLLMHAMSPNVSGVIDSAGVMINRVGGM
tara:strand:+ start:162 stop:416 length:255 start_codon:yes stop_codon:yes gene_type:complete